MASKLKGVDQLSCLCAISGILFGAILSFWSNESEETADFPLAGESLAELPGALPRRVHDGSFVLAMKFLHFLISKGLQFRFISPFNDHSVSLSRSALFWVALTRSVSSASMAMETLL